MRLISPNTSCLQTNLSLLESSSTRYISKIFPLAKTISYIFELEKLPQTLWLMAVAD